MPDLESQVQAMRRDGYCIVEDVVDALHRIERDYGIQPLPAARAKDRCAGPSPQQEAVRAGVVDVETDDPAVLG